jgi:hypothetical protein
VHRGHGRAQNECDASHHQQDRAVLLEEMLRRLRRAHRIHEMRVSNQRYMSSIALMQD